MTLLNDNLSALRALLPSDALASLDRDGDLPASLRAQLATDLRAQIAACSAYLPARLVRAQLAQPQPGRTGGAFWEGSLLFADLSGFTALSARLSVLGRQGAEEVSALVNRLFVALIAEVQARHGALLKFGGDALTAFFDADLLGSAHAAAAATAALAMQVRMAAFADMQTRAGTFTLTLRVGVHSGRVFAAEVGDTSHVELVVTGPEVNRVAMAQEIAAPGEVVVSDHTAGLLTDAVLEPRKAGFLRITSLPATNLPEPPPDPLTDSDPTSLGHIGLLAAQFAGLRPYLVRNLPRRFLDVADSGLGEFRPVTVLFANFADFSAILNTLGADASTAAAVLNAYYRRAQEVVHRYDGIVNKVDMYTHGDKLMALFGAPTAHEDDPTRAVRCALELKQALAEANAEIATLLPSTHSAQLTQAIGINTGTVFAGRVGGHTRYEYTVMGSTVNLAARLMSAAVEDEILLSPSTRATVSGQFTLLEGAPLHLKGLSEPVVPARVLAVAEVEQRSDDAMVNLRTAPLVGRDRELALLLRGATEALRGCGRVLAIVGEAGTGKSRLAEELAQRLVVSSVSEGVPPFAIYLGDCQSYEQRTPYAALRGPLSDLLGLSGRLRHINSAALLRELEIRVQRLAPDLLRFVPLLGDAIGMALPETALTAALNPQQRHDRLQELLTALFCGAAREPLLVAIEDVHWADLPSLELLGRLAAAIGELPLLLSLTYRPDPPINAPWDALAATVTVRLADLGISESSALLAALLGSEPPPTILPLLERTQGNPFFIEELVRGLILAGALMQDATGTWRAAIAIDSVELPKSIEGLLIARLDRLDEPRQELIQVASVIGRRFQRPVVEGVYAHTSTLEESLDRLISIELIQFEALERNLAYIFRHALLRDVAYAGILYARRRILHGKVARQIEALSQGDVDPHVTLLAWHYLQAEEWRPALHYHNAGADQARRRFANRDALALYEQALDIALRLPPTAERDAQIAAIHEHCGDLHLLLAEYDAARDRYETALAGSTVAREPWLRMHRMLATVEERQSRYEAAFDRLRPGMARATAALRAEMARCHLLGAGIYYRQGDSQRAMEWARMGLELAVQVADLADQARALKLIGNISQVQGDSAASIAALEQARARFEELSLLGDLCDALNDLGVAYLQLGRWRETIAAYEQSLQISDNIGDALAAARTSNNLAVVLMGRNDLERAAELYRRSSEGFARIGSPLGVAVTTQNRGEVLLHQGRPTEAISLLQRSIADYEAINARNFLPEALRLAGEASLALGELAAAHRYALQSEELAAELGMAAESAAARRGLAQVARAAGDLNTARVLLQRSRSELAQLDNRYELGKTLYQIAVLEREHGDPNTWIAARDQAAAIFRELDAQRDLNLLNALTT
ncbi:MAG: tetratricopeptide repeat protein [Oscillochloris sp.]|nr:tetratricopeptide repeat protein [Oscillochloris sp.]